jgi:1,4-alpha-glucan branching enzyme
VLIATARRDPRLGAGAFPKDSHGLARFDGTALYEHADPRKGEHQDWGTLIFNYGRDEVRTFLLSNALFWLEEFHVDGLRVDAVASMLYLDYSRIRGQWIPNQYRRPREPRGVAFLQQLNTLTHGRVAGTITVAEESTAWPAVSRPIYVEVLASATSGTWVDARHPRVLTQDPVHRRWHHGEITFSMLYAFTENFILPFSHDEVVHGKRAMLDKMPGDLWQKHASLRALYGYMFGIRQEADVHGCEFGQWREWNYDASLDWHLLRIEMHAGCGGGCRISTAPISTSRRCTRVDFEPSGFRWIDCNDNENSVVSFVRRARNPHDFTVIAANFTPVSPCRVSHRRARRRLVPRAPQQRQRVYGGGNVGNAAASKPNGAQMHGFDYSLTPHRPAIGLRSSRSAGKMCGGP